MIVVAALIAVLIGGAVAVGGFARATRPPKVEGDDGGDDGAEGERMAVIMVVVMLAMIGSAIWH